MEPTLIEPQDYRSHTHVNIKAGPGTLEYTGPAEYAHLAHQTAVVAAATTRPANWTLDQNGIANGLVVLSSGQGQQALPPGLPTGELPESTIDIPSTPIPTGPAIPTLPQPYQSPRSMAQNRAWYPGFQRSTVFLFVLSVAAIVATGWLIKTHLIQPSPPQISQPQPHAE